MKPSSFSSLLGWLLGLGLSAVTACDPSRGSPSHPSGTGGARARPGGLAGGTGGARACPGGLLYARPGCGDDVQPTCFQQPGGACGGTYCGCDGKVISGYCDDRSGEKWAWRFYRDPAGQTTCDPTDSKGSAGTPGSPPPDAPAD